MAGAHRCGSIASSSSKRLPLIRSTSGVSGTSILEKQGAVYLYALVLFAQLSYKLMENKLGPGSLQTPRVPRTQDVPARRLGLQPGARGGDSTEVASTSTASACVDDNDKNP